MSEVTLIDVTLHDVGEGLSEAAIVEWLVAPGQTVVEDQSIVVIATDKANVELPAPASGILREQVASVGATVALGGLLARIEVVGIATAGVRDTLPPSTSDEKRVPFNRLRLATARATAAAWREVPHIVEFRQVDATQLVKARQSLRARAEREGVHLTFLPFFVKAACVALTERPSFNARLDLDRNELIQRSHCNIGIAAASEGGLIVPVLRHAERQSILELAQSLKQLILRAKNQSPLPGDLTDGTFTLTNFGSYGTWLGTPIIRAPEVAIVGFGKIQDGVLAVNGAAVVRPILSISVATDHRVNDGIHLAAFLDTLALSLCDATLMSDHS